jgi:hypothetical protein
MRRETESIQFMVYLALCYFEENGPVITVSDHRDPEGYEFTVSVSTG